MILFTTLLASTCDKPPCNDPTFPPNIAPPLDISNPVLTDTLNYKSGLGFFQILIPNLISLAFVIGVILFVVIMITGAIQWISSGGDKNALEGARGKITNAIVGIVLLFTVYAIIRLVQDFFGITILTLDISKLIIQ